MPLKVYDVIVRSTDKYRVISSNPRQAEADVLRYLLYVRGKNVQHDDISAEFLSDCVEGLVLE